MDHYGQNRAGIFLFWDRPLASRLCWHVDLGTIRLTEEKEKPCRVRPRQDDSPIIGFRLPVTMTKAIKVIAARRQVPLKGPLAEKWQLYRENKRAG
jgi:hypothetical protein